MNDRTYEFVVQSYANTIGVVYFPPPGQELLTFSYQVFDWGDTFK